jgi:hypothetical protein
VSTDENAAAESEAAIASVAAAAFKENMGCGDFIALNCDGLVAFAHRNHLPTRVMNLAWSELQRRHEKEQEGQFELLASQLGMLPAGARH